MIETFEQNSTNNTEISEEELEQDRLRIVGQAILGRTITFNTDEDSAAKQPFTPVEKIPRTPESFAS